MDSPTAVRVLSIGPSRHPEAAAVLAEAFGRDDHVGGLLPGSDRARRLRALFDTTLDLGRHGGEAVDLAVEAEPGSARHTVLGAAIWEPPGAHASRWRGALALPRLAAVFGRRTPDALRTFAAAERARPERPHWYLAYLGTGLAARGRGAGSALLRHRLAEADAAGVGVYLESSVSANLAYYERFGFVEGATLPAYGTTRPIAMWREPGSGAG